MTERRAGLTVDDPSPWARDSDLIQPRLATVRDVLAAAANEARSVQPRGETWTDDQAHAVEAFALFVLAVLDA